MSDQDTVIRIDHLTETVHAFFGQVRTTADLIEHARLSAGVRVNVPKEGSTEAIWNVSGQYDFSESLYLRANAGTSFRLPSAFELFAVEAGMSLVSVPYKGSSEAQGALMSRTVSVWPGRSLPVNAAARRRSSA